MSLTNVGEAAMLDTYFGSGTFYAGLFTAVPGETGGGTEVAGGGYVRKVIAWAAAITGAPSSKANSAAIEFPLASAHWGIVLAIGVFDSLIGGNLIGYDNAPSSTPDIVSGTSIRLAAGDLVMTMD